VFGRSAPRRRRPPVMRAGDQGAGGFRGGLRTDGSRTRYSSPEKTVETHLGRRSARTYVAGAPGAPADLGSRLGTGDESREPAARLGRNVPSRELSTAAVAGDVGVRFASAALVAVEHRRALGGHVAIAPVAQRDQNWVQVVTLLGQPVLVTGAAVLVRRPLQDALLDEPIQAVSQAAPRYAEGRVEVLKSAGAGECLLDEDEGPAVAEDSERPADRTRAVELSIVSRRRD
jgi:hypothetical protein